MEQNSKETTPVSTDWKTRAATKYHGFSLESVWTEFTPLALKYNAVNLGQGFPDFNGPEFLQDAAKKAIEANANQYTRAQGHLRLVKALAAHYSPLLKREIDPMTEIVTTIGATEALFTTFQALLNPGDEVILIEPFYDSYPCDITIAGGVAKYVPLRPTKTPSTSSGDWVLDFKELEAAVTPKTKIILVNTPQNIPGKIYTIEELQQIADIAKKHDLLVISDEVYEGMTYDGLVQNRIATLPGMWERTLTIGSAGKSFSVTGWKIGWVIAPKYLITPLYISHQHTTFCTTTPLQEAVAVALEKCKDEEKAFFDDLKVIYQKRRDKMVAILKDVGLEPIVPQGSFFVLADFSRIDESVYMDPKDSATKDYQFCRWLVRTAGVCVIPPTAFFTPKNAHLAENLVRFTFCKKDETMEKAAERLQILKQYLKK